MVCTPEIYAVRDVEKEMRHSISGFSPFWAVAKLSFLELLERPTEDNVCRKHPMYNTIVLSTWGKFTDKMSHKHMIAKDAHGNFYFL